MTNDQKFMSLAIKLAEKAANPSPNPRVGAVLVKNGKIIATGYHKKAGTPHAEADAITKAGKHAHGATLYVTLEPCRLTGRTPPCVTAVIKAGIRTVVIGMRDPTKNGGGIKLLQRAGIEVMTGILADECRLLNQIWLKNIERRLPYVTLKLAFGQDYTTIPTRGKWITGSAARTVVHHARRRHDAILIGVQTAITDDPRLTVRGIKTSKQPIRIILDPHGRLPETARLLREPGTTIHVTEKATALPHAINLVLPRYHLPTLLKQLYARGITSIFVEGGLTTAQHFLAAQCIDRVELFFAPHVAPTSQVGTHTIPLLHTTQQRIGHDTLRVGFITQYGC